MNGKKFTPWSTTGCPINQYRFKCGSMFERSITIELIDQDPHSIVNVDAALNKIQAQQWIEDEGVINAIDPQYTEYCLN